MDLRELPIELKKLTASNEENGCLEKEINYIINWIEKTPHLNARTDPQWIASFLRGCKYSHEKTKEKLDKHYTVKTLMPELFSNRDPHQSKIKEILELGTYLPLPLTEEPDAPRVVLVRGAIYDPKKYYFLDTVQVFSMIWDLLLLADDQLTVVGQHIVLDLIGSRLEHAAQFSPSVIKKSITCFQDAFPIKTKSLHFINPPPSFEVIFSIFKRFMNEKLKNRVMVHGKMDDVFKHIPKRIFPKDYGGEGPSIEALTQEWKRKVMENRDWFIEDSKFQVVESLRGGEQVSSSDLFGVEGSFKQLNLD